MQKKKILILPGALKAGGAETVARDIALFSNRERYEFHYVVYGSEVGEYEAALQKFGCRIFHFPEPSENYVRYLCKLFRLLLREDYHAVHAHTMFSCGWAMGAAWFAGVPVRVAHAHSALLDGGGWGKDCYEAMMRWLILHCATVLAACAEPAGLRLFGDRAWEERGILLPNGIDNGAFSYRVENRRTIRGRYGLENCFVIGHAGRLDGVKNQSFLLDLLPELRKNRPDARLLLLGEGKDRLMLEQKIKAMGLSDYVIMAGNVTDVDVCCSAMDVFCFPSLYEGMPLALLEARANGLPCLVSDRVESDGLPLEKPDAWVAAICKARRGDANPGPDIREAMERVYALYEQNKGFVP